MTPDKIAKAARRLIVDKPTLEAPLREAWGRVVEQIEARARSQRPKPKSFEVHHETQVARLAFLTAAVEGRSIEAGEIEALQRVGIVKHEAEQP